VKCKIWPAVVVAGFFVSAAIAEDQSKEELKRDAVSRVVEAHDVSLPVNIGRVYVKQAALTGARDLLAEKGKAAGLDRKVWNMDSPQWQGAELQRRVIEWFVGELILQTYTFTDRLKFGVPGSEQEMRDLQVATYEAKSHFAPIYDLTNYEGTMRFATSEAGNKYFKMMAIQGVNLVHQHLELAEEARKTIRSRAALVDAYIARVAAPVSR
jgi:hypothetical protein